ncbi:CRISPR-associated helicase Cas3' [uncultured Anaerococcus sp.]|uniref:CRISPR-associated helicase Cas3' n=1 Tax=uncultured Anaerococcus sp. TaxID=293428 RepID=UPI002889AD2C|nr:CRISPR-associated helicase Cas3' [uncultured Anaerococcus sp.]
MFENLFAHIDQKDNDRKQKLINHLINTADECEKIGKRIGLAKASYLVGLLHDIGKCSDKFQKKILNNSNAHVDHSSLGGYILYRLSNDILNSEEIDNIFLNNGLDAYEVYDYTNILIYVIMSHHGQYDQVRESKDRSYVYTSFERIDKISNENFDIDYERALSLFLKNNIDLKDIYIKAYAEYIDIIKKLNKYGLGENKYQKEALDFYKGLLTRTLSSILKSSDIKDTINSYDIIIEDENEERLGKAKKEFEEKVNEKYSSFKNPSSPINIVRNKIANDILLRSKKDTAGIYKLDLPTGAGKTLLSLRYGINQLNYQNKERFFYITSFLSVLEQNAKEIREVLGNDEYILEHHSNVMDKEIKQNDDIDDSFESIRRDYLLDNWSYPIIMTTMVQFFNTIFKGKSANITRFKSLINSVIIIDEYQSIPIEYIYLTNLALNYLKIVLNATIVLSTATQPTNSEKTLKHMISYGDIQAENENIVDLDSKDLDCFKRVDLKLYGNVSNEYGLDDIKNLILTNKNKSILVILNTKKAVKELYDILSFDIEEEDLYYLTTNLTAFDRIRKIREIKERLNRNDKICLISTQLIGAGVDVDFECVIRSISGVDSIVQAMGRCNREGKRGISNTYVINVNKNIEKTSTLKGIDERKEAARYVFRNTQGDINLSGLVNKYFRKLYANIDEKNLSNILDLLASNKKCRDLYIKSQNNRTCNIDYGFIYEIEKDYILNMFQSFKKAQSEFAFIEDNQNTAIIEYEASKDIINKLRDLEIEFKTNYNLKTLKEIKKLSRKLSIHSVNINKKDLDKASSILDGMLYIVDSIYYDPKFGLDFDGENIFLL